MAENYGGPVWHASARGANERESLRIARLGLHGVGDASLGEWVDTVGMGRGIVHAQRRLSDQEVADFDVPEPLDIRGTLEERERIAVVVNEASPAVRAQLEAVYGRQLA